MPHTTRSIKSFSDPREAAGLAALLTAAGIRGVGTGKHSDTGQDWTHVFVPTRSERRAKPLMEAFMAGRSVAFDRACSLRAPELVSNQFIFDNVLVKY